MEILRSQSGLRSRKDFQPEESESQKKLVWRLGLFFVFFLSLGLGFEGFRSRFGLEGFRSRYRALRLETLHRLFFMKFCKEEFIYKTVLKNDCSKFSRSKRSVAKLSLLLCCLRDGENNLPSTSSKFILNSIKKQSNRSGKSLQRETGSTLLRTIFELFLLWNP